MQARSIWLALFAVCLGCGRVRNTYDDGQPPTSNAGAGSSAGTGGFGGSVAAGNGGNEDAGSGADAGEAGSSSTPADVTVLPTWRLTNVEFSNTVQDLLGVAVKESLDPDSVVAGYTAGTVAGDATVLDYHAAAIQIAADAIGQVAQLVPCTTAEISADGPGCAGKFIDAFGPKAFRRPLDAATKTGLLQFHAAVSAQFGFNAGIQALLEELLQSPYFLYHLELEEHDLGPGKVAVSGYSMASRLSYLLWSTLPDSELFAEAAAGRLVTPAQIRAQATRMLADPKAKQGLRNFYEQWLSVRAFPDTKGGTYSGNGPAQKASILASFGAQADDALWSPSNGLKTLLTGNRAYIDENTATLLGAPRPAPGPLQAFTLDATQRIGILTHPAIMGTLATDTGSHPIKRGTFVWDRILCQPLPNPPPNVPTFPGVAAGMSVRRAYEAFDAPTTCQKCHVQIDPVGFAFENFDTLGAYRTLDDAQQPVDAAVTISGATDTTVNGPAANALELLKRLAASGEVTQCFATQLFRYASRREENSADQAFLADLATSYAQSGQSTQQILTALTQSETFLSRINEE